MVSRSPWPSCFSWIDSPFTNVPFVLPRSTIQNCSSRSSSLAWCPLVAGSRRITSLSGDRPMRTAWSPVRWAWPASGPVSIVSSPCGPAATLEAGCAAGSSVLGMSQAAGDAGSPQAVLAGGLEVDVLAGGSHDGATVAGGGGAAGAAAQSAVLRGGAAAGGGADAAEVASQEGAAGGFHDGAVGMGAGDCSGAAAGAPQAGAGTEAGGEAGAAGGDAGADGGGAGGAPQEGAGADGGGEATPGEPHVEIG